MIMEHPAYLIIGSPDVAKQKAYEILMQAFCVQKGCNSCIACVQIKEHRHHAMRWMVPEGQFKVDQLTVIFDTICYSLDEGQHFFFILERADLLNMTAANSLLKSLEEPPAGYHFILLAPWQEGILPTIASRCVTINCGGESHQQHALVKFFMQERPNMPEFAKEVDKIKPNDKEVFDIFDAVYYFYAEKYKQSYKTNSKQEHYQAIIDRLDILRNYPPMPGSGKIFLKNLYLQCYY